MRAPLRDFKYGRDPICLFACTCYAANRWCVPAALKGVFLRGYCNDLFLIPAALPLALWLQRRLGLRPTDAVPNWREILMHLAVWSVAAEVVGPHWFARATGDIWDVVAYGAGAVVAALLWSVP